MNWDYLAGWFDADGHVSIVNRDAKWKKAKGSGTYRKRYVLLTFGNTDLGMIQEIQRFLGLERLKVHTQKADKYDKQKSDYHKLQVVKRDEVAKILIELHPRCITKKHLIQDALAYLKAIAQHRKSGRRKSRSAGRLYY